MDSPLAVVETLCRAVAEGGIEDLLACYGRSPELTVFPEGPRWITRGFPEVARGWRAYGRSAITVTGVSWADGPYVHSGADLACVSGILLLHTAAQEPVRLRLTWTLAHGGDGWRIVHEHGSQPVADPYGIGDWLTDARTDDRTDEEGS